MTRAGITRVVIVGGGFAGLNAAKELGAARSDTMEIVVVDRRNHHLFQPLLYQVAMAGLSPADISTPIRTELRRFDNVRVQLGLATGVDLDGRVWRSADVAAGQWRPVGDTGGQPAAFESGPRDELLVALHDGVVQRSTDGGRTWTVRSRP